MPLPAKINLPGLDPLQGRMFVLLWQQFLHAKRGDIVGATVCFQDMIMLCQDNEPLAIDMGKRMEQLHMTVGCGENCQHNKGDKA